MPERSPADFVKHLLTRVRELAKLVEDHRLPDSEAINRMDDISKKVMSGKKLATWKHLLDRFGYEDKQLIPDVAAAFRITGMQPYTSAFDFQVLLPSSSVDDLRLNSDLNNQAMLSRVRSSGDRGVDKTLWEQVELECNSGWLFGPFVSPKQLEEIILSKPHLCRRFPLLQGASVRPIDDLSESGANGAFGCHDKMSFLDVDTICAVISMLEKILCDGLCEVKLRTGMLLQVEVHREWLSIPLAKTWAGKTFDLSKAYKQLCVHPSERWSTPIAVFNPCTGSAVVFGQATLPFGASGAVLAFNRASKSLWFLGLTFLEIVWTSFYDDYPTLAPLLVSRAVDKAVHLFLNMLGWIVTSDPSKTFDFAESFNALGVAFRVGRLILGDSTVENKPARVLAVRGQLQQVIACKRMPKPLAESLRGKVQFMENSVFGRAARSASKVFRSGRSL